MEIRQEDSAPIDEQISVWSVRRRLFAGYFVTFSLLFVLVSGLAAWLSYTPIYDVRDAADLAMTAMGMASGRTLWLAAFSIIAVEVSNVIVEYLIVDRYKRGKSEGIKEGIKEGIREGIKEGIKEGIREGAKGERSKWQAWYERQQAAQREGLPFDEPPPGVPDDKGT